MIQDTDHRQLTEPVTAVEPPGYASGQRLAALLASEDFLARRYGVEPVRWHGRPDEFTDVLRWSELNALVRNQRFAHPRLRLMASGRVVDPARYSRTVRTYQNPFPQLDTPKVLRILRAGATLVIDAIDQAHPPVRQVKTAVERVLGVYASINLYGSWGTTQGLDLHWDPHDVIVIQVAGTKHWAMHRPTRRYALANDTEDPPKPTGDPDLEMVLSAGDALYLPRGWWHRVAALGEPSLHLTFGLDRPTGVDFLQWIVRQAITDEVARSDVPSGEGQGWLEQMRNSLLSHLGAATLERFRESTGGWRDLDPTPTLQAVGLPIGAWATGAVAFLLTTDARLTAEADGVRFRAGGGDWLLPAPARPALEELSAGRGVSVSHLLGLIPEADLVRLVETGILSCE